MTMIQIHAGNHKTGSTAIQRVLRELRPRLARRGIHMPGLDETDAKHGEVHHELVSLLPNRPTPRLDRILSDIRATGPGARHLLTNETFIGVDPQRFRDVLAPVSPDRTMVYFYVRPHAGLLVSLYLQSVKNGRVHDTPAEYVSRKGENEAFHFIPAINDYGAVFGDSNVFVREFSRDALKDGSIIADMWNFLDLPPKMVERALAVAALSNPTPKAEVAEILRALTVFFRNEDGREPGEVARASVFAMFRAFNEIAPDLPGTPYRLTVELQEQLAATYTGARREFAARWFAAPPTAGWLTEPVVAPLPPIDPPREVVEQVFARGIHRNRNRGRERYADLAAEWLRLAPTRTEQGVPVIPIDGLVDTFAARAA